MNLQWNGEERIPVPKERVWAFITDPKQLATCVPDVLETSFRDDRNFDATVQVALGPVRGKFKFKIEIDPQADGTHLNLKISGSGLGSTVDLTAGAEIKDDGDATTTLDWNATAAMRGPVANIGGRVIDAQAHKVIAQTFANVKTRVAAAA
ncbi:MAG: carbon monoxide dehydrogenase subunit G [Candidatus Baltobacteraceae bacterium]